MKEPFFEVKRFVNYDDIPKDEFEPYEQWGGTTMPDRPRSNLLTLSDYDVSVLAKQYIGEPGLWSDVSPNPYPTKVFVVENPGAQPHLWYPEE